MGERPKNRREVLGFGAKVAGVVFAESLRLNRWAVFGLGSQKRPQALATPDTAPDTRPVRIEPIRPATIAVPTAEEIEAFLPGTLNPQFFYPPDEESSSAAPAFVALGPFTFSRIVDKKQDKENGVVEASEGQKYLEFKFTADPGRPLYERIWLSFANQMPDDLEPLRQFSEDNSPADQYRIVFPILPPDEWRIRAIKAYRESRLLTREEAIRFDAHLLKSVTRALIHDASAVDSYFATFSTAFIRPADEKLTFKDILSMR